MSSHAATIRWARGDAPFRGSAYQREHSWHFDGGTTVTASASPQRVPLPFSTEAAVDPEEAFVAALSSCHMLWFLAFASRDGLLIDSYVDEASGVLEADAKGLFSMTKVVLRPKVTAAEMPAREVLEALHPPRPRVVFLGAFGDVHHSGRAVNQDLAHTHLAAQVGLTAGTLVLDGRFRVERLLGGGGMGLVYLAEQVSLGRKVALKVLREDLPLTANVGERFRREALLLSSVEHPGVVRVIDFGHHGASACLVMELVEGDSLETVLLREAPMSVERTEAIILQLAQGLSAIHERGIIHRDLKPDNVTLSKNTQGLETARLLDFGIARLAAPDEASHVTQVGFVLGTPEYMSPEQAMGQALDARSDVYSLGVLAYRMLTGVHPFSGPSPTEFVSQHIHAEPRALLVVSPHLETFPRLVGLVTDMLAKKPEARPQTAQEVVERLTQAPIALAKTLSSVMAAQPASSAIAAQRSGLGQAQKAGLLTIGIIVVVGAVSSALVFNQPERRARRLIEAGRGSEALQIIDDAGGELPSWPLKMLKGTALYQVGRLEDARKLLEGVPSEVALEAEAVKAVADDFGRNEAKDARPRKLLEKWPKAKVLPLMQAFASGKSSWHQWGALRFVDLQFAGQGLPLVPLYIDALASKDCAIRVIAAKRLGELRSVEAVAPLEALKAQPKKPDCGQDAAGAALVKLEHELRP